MEKTGDQKRIIYTISPSLLAQGPELGVRGGFLRGMDGPTWGPVRVKVPRTSAQMTLMRLQNPIKGQDDTRHGWKAK